MALFHEELSKEVIAAAIEVHRALGPGLLESVYEECLGYELLQRGMHCQRQAPLPVRYKYDQLECGYRIDLIVNNVLIVELKSIDSLQGIHEAQLMTYLRLSGKKVGLLINFNVMLLKDGIVRRVI